MNIQCQDHAFDWYVLQTGLSELAWAMLQKSESGLDSWDILPVVNKHAVS